MAGDMSSLAWPMCFWETVRCHYEVTISSLLLSTDSLLLSQAVMQPGWATANMVCFHGKSVKYFWLKGVVKTLSWQLAMQTATLFARAWAEGEITVYEEFCHHLYEIHLRLSQRERKISEPFVFSQFYFVFSCQVLGYSVLFIIPFNPLH